MPQATPEQSARWPGGDAQAIKFLEDAGYRLNRDWQWIEPQRHQVSDQEADAISYLIHEWDFGGLVDRTDKPPQDTFRMKIVLQMIEAWDHCLDHLPDHGAQLLATNPEANALFRFGQQILRSIKDGKTIEDIQQETMARLISFYGNSQR